MIRPRKKAKIITLPALPRGLEPTLQRFLQSINDSITGRGSNRLITLDDIVSSGIGDNNNGVLVPSNPNEPVDMTVPPKVTNFGAAGAYMTVTLTWDRVKISNFGFNRIYRADTDDFGLAVAIGTTMADVYTDAVGNNANKFYWVRTVSTAGIEGVISDVANAQTAIDVEYMLELLEGQLSTSQLQTALTTRLNKIESNESAIEVQQTKIQGISAQYMVKLDVNGFVSGFGLYNTGKTSNFIINTNMFAIGSPTTAGAYSYPFIFTDGTTTIDGVSVPAGAYIKAAYIHNGSITNAKIKDLAADKITSGYIAAARIQAGTIDADKLTSNTVTGMFANFGLGTFKSSASGQRTEISGKGIKVYDSSGVLRIELGDF